MSEFDELVSRDGVLIAGRFGPDWRVAEYKSVWLMIEESLIASSSACQYACLTRSRFSRRRYGTSHGVGLLHRLAGLEGTYAVASTVPAPFTALLRRDPTVDRTSASA